MLEILQNLQSVCIIRVTKIQYAELFRSFSLYGSPDQVYCRMRCQSSRGCPIVVTSTYLTMPAYTYMPRFLRFIDNRHIKTFQVHLQLAILARQQSLIASFHARGEHETCRSSVRFPFPFIPLSFSFFVVLLPIVLTLLTNTARERSFNTKQPIIKLTKEATGF